MKKVKDFEQFITEKKEGTDILTSIKYARIPKELKDDAVNYVTDLTSCKKGKITELKLHPELIKKIKEKNLPDGFSMGIDKDGYYVHTHRARCKSYESPSKISVKDIKFIDSTG